jgi:hypothetical protein
MTHAPGPAATGKGLRLVVFDATGHGRSAVQPWLTASWQLGSALYRRHPRAPVDARFAAHGWTDALAWLASVQPTQPIAEIQFWGHGRPGRVFIADDALHEDDFVAGRGRGSRGDDLRAVRDRLVGSDALVWWRTCSAYGGRRGQAFAAAVSSFFGCRSAGHTYVIGPWQSGLHSLAAGAAPAWDPREGVRDDDEGLPSLASTPWAPHTIHFLQGTLPPGW